jgi:hypothetical protein
LSYLEPGSSPATTRSVLWLTDVAVRPPRRRTNSSASLRVVVARLPVKTTVLPANGRVFVTNSVKCRPPQNRAPRDDELTVCRQHWLDRQIGLVAPGIIVFARDGSDQTAVRRLATTLEAAWRRSHARRANLPPHVSSGFGHAFSERRKGDEKRLTAAKESIAAEPVTRPRRPLSGRGALVPSLKYASRCQADRQRWRDRSA